MTTTLADAIKGALDANWAGSGGTKPALYNTEDVGHDWPPDDDWIMTLNWTYEEGTRRRNDGFVRKVYRIDLRAHSKNDANKEERLETIVTEIYRIIKPANVTGYHIVDIVGQNRRASDKRVNRYIADLTVECIILSMAAAATPGSGGTGDVEFPRDVAILRDLAVTRNTTVGGTLGVTGNTTLAGALESAGPITSKHTTSLRRHTTGSYLGLISTTIWNDGTSLFLYDSASGLRIFYDGDEIANLDSSGNLQHDGSLTIGSTELTEADLISLLALL